MSARQPQYMLLLKRWDIKLVDLSLLLIQFYIKILVDGFVLQNAVRSKHNFSMTIDYCGLNSPSTGSRICFIAVQLTFYRVFLLVVS